VDSIRSIIREEKNMDILVSIIIYTSVFLFVLLVTLYIIGWIRDVSYERKREELQRRYKNNEQDD